MVRIACVVVVVAGLVGCVVKGETSGFNPTSTEGYLESSTGGRCPLEQDSGGFCLDGASTFSAGSGVVDCPNDMHATAWVGPGIPNEGDTFDLQPNSTSAGPGVGAVWFDEAGETWTTSSGTAVAHRSGEYVAIEFHGETVDFLTNTTPGPSIDGVIWCFLP